MKYSSPPTRIIKVKTVDRFMLIRALVKERMFFLESIVRVHYGHEKTV